MKKNLNLISLFASMIFTILSCSPEEIQEANNGSSSTNPEQDAAYYSINGSVQKGPFLQGTTITIHALDDQLNPTGKNWHTKTIDDAGTFKIDNQIECRYVELTAAGYYYNEVAGNVSASTLTLRAISDLTEEGKTNVNILTTLEADRIRNLVKTNGKTIRDAREQTEQEIMKIFNIPTEVSLYCFDKMDITKNGEANAVLLAISATLQSNRSVGELSELISKIALEISSSGTLNNENLIKQIKTGGMLLDIDLIKKNLQNRYEYLNITDYKIPPFEDYLDINGNGVIDSKDKWLIIDSNEFHLTHEGGEFNVSTRSNIKYQVTIECDGDPWIKNVTTKAYLEESKLSFVVEPNLTYDDRYAQICIKDTESSYCEYIYVSQKKKDALIISQNKVELSKDDETFTIEVLSNIDYNVEITEGRDWLSQLETKALTSSLLTFKTEPNYEAETRCGTIRISSGAITENISVYQSGGRILILNQNEYTLSDSGAKIEVIASANVDYEIIMPQVSWIHEEQKTKGMVTDIRTFIVEANDSYDPRTAEIIFKDKTSDLQEKVTIYQAQKDAIVIAKETYTFDNNGGMLSFEVNSNVSLDVSIPDNCNDWIKQIKTKGLETHIYNFSIEPNPEYSNREGEIVISSPDRGISKSIAIYQAQKNTIILSESEINVDSEGCTVNVVVNSNIDFTVKTSDNWINQIKTKALESHNLTFSILPNDGHDSRTATITIENTETNIKETVTIRQEQKNALIIGINERTIDYNGGILNIEVKSNIDYIVEIADTYDWLSLVKTKGLETSYVSISVEKNNEIYDRTGTVIIRDGKTGLKNNVTIVQTANTEPRTIHVETAGTLSQLLSEAMQANLTSLTLTGIINDADFDTLENMPKLKELDLSGAKTPSNIIPDEALGYEFHGVGGSYAKSNSNLKKIILPEGIISIGEFAFGGIDSLTVINIPSTVRQIKKHAFARTNIEHVHIPAEVTIIERAAFERNKNLKTLEFAEGSKLSSILSHASNDPLGTTDTDGAFDSCTSLKKVEIPASLTSIGVGTFNDCTALEEFIIPEDTKLTELTGYYYLPQYDLGAKPVTGGLMEGCWNLKELHVPAAITKIDNSAFINTGIQKVTFAKNSRCETIGNSSFANCYMLNEIDIPSTVTTIGSYVFANCSTLQSINIADAKTMGVGVFQGCMSLKSILLPSEISEIPQNTFNGCSELKGVELHDNITKIGEAAFADCISLENIPSSETLYYISSHAFRGCTSFKEVIVPSSVKYIMREAFANCTSMTEFSLAHNAEIFIETRPFIGCSNLQKIGMYAKKVYSGVLFEGTPITSLEIPAEVEYWGAPLYINKTDHNCRYSFDRFDKNEYTHGTIFYNSKVSEITFEAGSQLKECGTWAFAGAEYLTSIKLPESVETLGACIFEGCTLLYEWTIPDHIKRLSGPVYAGSSIFDPRIEHPENILELGPLALYGISNSSLDLSNCHYIGDAALTNCKNLRDIKLLSTGALTLGSLIFKDSPIDRITIPAGMTEILSCGINMCYNIETDTDHATNPFTSSNIEEITCEENCQLSVIAIDLAGTIRNFKNDSKIHTIDLHNCISKIFTFGAEGKFGTATIKDKNALLSFKLPSNCEELILYFSSPICYTQGLEYFEIPSSLSKITGSRLFSEDCDIKEIKYLGNGFDVFDISGKEYSLIIPSNIEKVIMPNATKIGSKTTFAGKTFLKDVDLGSLTYYNEKMFANCSSLEALTINGCVQSIGKNAFDGCTSLKSVRFEKGDPIELDEYIFKDFNGEIYINRDILTPIFKEAVIDVNGITFGEDVKTFPVILQNYKEVFSIEIPKWMTSIQKEAFRGCSGLTEISIPDSVTAIGESAFYGCSGLTEITIPHSLTEIKKGTFYGCTSLSEITIPGTVESISSGALMFCNNLNSLTFEYGDIPLKIKDEYEAADWNYDWNYDWNNTYTYSNIINKFNGKVIVNREIEAEYNSSGLSAFFGNQVNITDVIIANDITIVPPIFKGVVNLTEITLPESITRIPASSFEGCSGLAGINIPGSVNSIESNAFKGCANLKLLKFMSSDSVCSISPSAFSGLTDLDVIIERRVDGACMKAATVNSVVFRGNFTIGSMFNGYSKALSPIIENGIIGIADNAFNSCTQMSSIELPESITSIGNSAFYKCSGLKELIIPDQVTNIGNSALYGCNLELLKLGKGITEIGNGKTFIGGTGTGSSTKILKVSENISHIDFGQLSGLEEIHCPAKNPPTTKNINKITTNATIYVPQQSVDAYKASSHWSTKANLIIGY